MTAAAADPSEAGMSRHERLTAAAARIRVRPGVNLPVERILLIAASILFPLGLIFVLLGWYGAAHTGRTYAQIDYLISGGLFGLGLSVAGGFMYFGYWLSRQLGESRRQNGLTLQALGRLEELLDASLNSRVAAGGDEIFAPPAPRANSTRRAATAGRNGSGRAPAAADTPTGEVPAATLLATPKGSLLHRPDCPVVARRTDLQKVRAGTDGYGYCTMCDAAGVLT
jgi:hypothetical protein